MIIEYKDIKLRSIEESDLEMLKEMQNDPEIENMVGGYSYPVSTYQQKKWFEELSYEKDEIRYIIDTNKYGPIGTIIMSDIDWKNSSAELGIKIINKNELRGKGYGPKATKALCKYAFEELNLNSLYLYSIEYNIPGHRSAEKCGFKKDGVLRENIYKNNKYHDLFVFTLLKGEFND